MQYATSTARVFRRRMVNHLQTAHLQIVMRCALALALLAAPGAVRAQITPLPHTGGAPGSFFGTAVAIDGDLALVGASGEYTCAENGGAVYVFERSGGAWRRTARLVPGDCRANAFFGRSLALSGDRALIGAVTEFFATAASNAAYVFEREPDGAWQETARLTVDPQRAGGAFATSVALDGDRALVTTLYEDAAPEASVRRRGAAYIFERTAEGDWQQAARLFGRARGAGAFGSACALNGGRAVVTASARTSDGRSAAYVFERLPGGAWHEAAYLPGLRGAFVDADLEGERLVVGESRRGANRSGAVALYTRRAGGDWEQTATLRPHAPYALGAFGSAVSLGGGRLLVTGYDEQLGLDINIARVVYVFAYDDAAGRWRQQQVIDIGEVDFATALDHDGGTALIGHAPAGAAFTVGLL